MILTLWTDILIITNIKEKNINDKYHKPSIKS